MTTETKGEIGVKQFTGLCLGVGGMKGVLLLGALHAFWTRGQLHNLVYYAGSSVGAMIVALLAVGYEPLELLTVICDPYFASQFGALNFGNVGSLMGLFPHSILRTKLEELMLLKLGYLPTLGDLLHRLNKHVVVAEYCLSEPDPRKSKIYFSPLTHPDVSVVDAVILSCSIPGIFQKAKWRDKIWVDGACTSMFPIEALQTAAPPQCPILALTLRPDPTDLETLAGYFYAVVSIPFRDQVTSAASSTDVIEIASEPINGSFINALNFAAGSRHKIGMFTHAVKQVQDLIQRQSSFVGSISDNS
jgi:predicted acylesterase/phospholipase RssA